MQQGMDGAAGQQVKKLPSSYSGYLVMQVQESQFDDRFLDLMQKKTKLIDVSKISLYIDFAPKTQDPEGQS